MQGKFFRFPPVLGKQVTQLRTNREANLTLSDPRFCLCLDSSKRSPHRHTQSGEARRAVSAAHRAPARLSQYLSFTSPSTHAGPCCSCSCPSPQLLEKPEGQTRGKRHLCPELCQNPLSEQEVVRLEATFCCWGDQSNNIRTKILASHNFSKL